LTIQCGALTSAGRDASNYIGERAQRCLSRSFHRRRKIKERSLLDEVGEGIPKLSLGRKACVMEHRKIGRRANALKVD
jgi:hypothetical protein